jgi:hypothetical protein
MADTIEWLETIGKSATLRRASAEELAHTLEHADASDALKTAVLHGDSTLLSTEFGQKDMHSENSTHTHPRPPHHPDEHEEEEEPAHHEDEPPHPKEPQSR